MKRLNNSYLMQRADLTNACNLKNLKRADAERAVEKAKERLAKVFGIKVIDGKRHFSLFLFLVTLKFFSFLKKVCFY